jgi:sugar phosphate isomerase/epimerase
MELKVFKSLWGVPSITEETFSAYANIGYQGLEFKSLSAVACKKFGDWLKKYGLDFIAQVHTEGISVEDHLYSFESLINTALTLHPLIINSQSGCDYWSSKDKCRFLETALKLEEKYKIKIAHETHRSRITYNPWDTVLLIEHFPDVRIGCDFSHWVNVCERLLTTESKQLDIVMHHCLHIHARTGYEQGPQVPDPRAPEYKNHLEAHESWWLQIWQIQKQHGVKVSTVCPEYGPPLYQHTTPHTNKPVADIHEISDWSMHRLRSLFDSVNKTK